MTYKRILFIILFVAALLRIWNLGSGDITGSDEVFYAFRAVGMLDFDNAPAQTTPLQWLDPNIPSWTSLSFHDHPPLVFWIQHLFIKIFGENNFAFRFPSAILGIISVYLLYLIGGRLFSRRVGLMAAAIMAVTVNSVWISRVGLQEAYVIFFVLLAIYLFLRVLGENSYFTPTPERESKSTTESRNSRLVWEFIWAGVVVGLAGLTKYTALVIVPIFLTYLLLFRREVFRQKNFWFGITAAILVFSPVIIYNINLYRAVGHFDFQFSYIFGQQPEVWQAAPGKEIGTLGDRLRQFVPNLFKSNGYGFLSFFAAALFLFTIKIFKKPTEVLRTNALLISAFIYLFLMILAIGPSFRFLAILTPFIALTNAIFLIGAKPYGAPVFRPGRPYENFLQEHKHAAYAVLGALLLSAMFYSINSQVLAYPIGSEFWTYSRVRYENYNWGYNELDKFLQKELAGKYPALNFRLQYQFLEDIKNRSIEKSRANGFEPYPALIVYDSNIQQAAQLWILDRLQLYHGWPVASVENYLALSEVEKNAARYRYFIKPTDKVPLRKTEQFTTAGAELETSLIASGLEPLVIKNKRGDKTFKIYLF